MIQTITLKSALSKKAGLCAQCAHPEPRLRSCCSLSRALVATRPGNLPPSRPKSRSRPQASQTRSRPQNGGCDTVLAQTEQTRSRPQNEVATPPPQARSRPQNHVTMPRRPTMSRHQIHVGTPISPSSVATSKRCRDTTSAPSVTTSKCCRDTKHDKPGRDLKTGSRHQNHVACVVAREVALSRPHKLSHALVLRAPRHPLSRHKIMSRPKTCLPQSSHVATSN